MTDRGDQTQSGFVLVGDKARARSKSLSSMMGWCIAIFILGLAVRLTRALVTFRSNTQVGSEAIQIAKSLATTGNYSDAYGTGVGPTAHCAPLYPLLLSVVFRLLGTGAKGAIAVSMSASVAAALAFAFLPAVAVASSLTA